MKEARPTSGRVLLALFNILTSLSAARESGEADFSFLDLFAGTGRVGQEALKRGARPVVFVETLKDRARALEHELRNATPDALVLGLELRRALAWLIKRGFRFDTVFADPPYNEGWGKALLLVDNLPKVLKDDGILIVEHATRETLHVPEGWMAQDARAYGETTLTFLKRTATREEGEA